jgi:hypothetical protein
VTESFDFGRTFHLRRGCQVLRAGAISQQCGFASGAASNPFDQQRQTEKLELVVDLACEVWSVATKKCERSKMVFGTALSAKFRRKNPRNNFGRLSKDCFSSSSMLPSAAGCSAARCSVDDEG